MVKVSGSGNPFNGKKFTSAVKKEIVEAIMRDPRGSKALMEKHGIGRRTIYNYRKKYITGVPVSESKGRGSKIDETGAEVILEYWNSSAKKSLSDPRLLEIAKEQAQGTLRRRRLDGQALEGDANVTVSLRTIARIVNPTKKTVGEFAGVGVEV